MAIGVVPWLAYVMIKRPDVRTSWGLDEVYWWPILPMAEILCVLVAYYLFRHNRGPLGLRVGVGLWNLSCVPMLFSVLPWRELSHAFY